MSIVVCNCSKSFVKKNKDLFRWNDAPLTNGKQYELVKVHDFTTEFARKFSIVLGINYSIIDNSGKVNLYPAKLFIPLAELRQKQIDSVLKD